MKNKILIALLFIFIISCYTTIFLYVKKDIIKKPMNDLQIPVVNKVNLNFKEIFERADNRLINKDIPSFDDYSVQGEGMGFGDEALIKIDYDNDLELLDIRDVLGDNVSQRQVDFGGFYKIFEISCGTGCSSLAVVNLTTGKVIRPEIRADFGFKYEDDSLLLVVNPPEALYDIYSNHMKDWPEDLMTKYYRWNGSKFEFITKAKVLYQVEKNKNIINKSIKDLGEYYSVDVNYPEIIDLTNKAKQTKVNQAIKEYIVNKIANWKRYEGDILKGKLPERDEKEYKDYKAMGVVDSLGIEYSAHLISDKIVSIKFTLTEYGAGAAHPVSDPEGFNYDLEKEKVITLADLFDDSKYLEFLSKLAYNDLSSRSYKFDSKWLASGTESRLENFSSFVFDNDNLIIYFKHYQIESYSGGVFNVAIPYVKMKDKINKSGPLRYFIK